MKKISTVLFVFVVGFVLQSNVAHSLSSTPTPSSYTLSISKSPTAGGSVGDLSNGSLANNIINCGNTCSTIIASNQTISLRATPATGYSFAGWSGSCTGTGDCSLTMNSDKPVTATFTDIQAPTTPSGQTATAISTSQIDVTWSASTDNASVSYYNVYKCQLLGCSGTLTNPAVVSASPLSGTYTYQSTGLTAGSYYSYKVTAVDAAGNESALPGSFAIAQTLANYTLTVSNTLPAGGTVGNVTGSVVTGDIINCGSTCSALLVANTTVVLRATPTSGYTFTGWGGVCSGTGDCTVTLNAAKTVVATFSDTTSPTISAVSASPVTVSGATITWTTNESSDTQIEYGLTTSYGNSTTLNSSLVTAHSQALTGLTAGTLYHYRVKSKDAAGNTTTSSDYTFTTTATYTISLTKSPFQGGTVGNDSFGTITGDIIMCNTSCSSVTSVNIPSGTSVTLRASPAAGYALSSWGGSCSGTGTCVLSMTSNKTVTATFVDSVAPSITGVSATLITTTGTTITWTTNEGADTQVEYGLTTAYGNLTTINSTLLTSHSQVLSGLTPNTLYHYRVKSKDVDGNLTTSTDYTFTTAPVYTVTVSRTPSAGGTVGNVSGTTVSGDLINCGTTCSTSLASNSTLVLRGSPTSGYSFTGWSGDCTGSGDCVLLVNAAKSVVASFADITSPTISAVTAGSITVSGATITWTTNESSDTQIEYGLTTSYGNSTTLNSSLVTAHSQALTGLTAGTLYHYRVKSRDSAGNLATSADYTFTTSATYTISLTKTPTVGGTVGNVVGGVVVGDILTCSTACSSVTSGSVTSGSTVTLRATPATGYSFSAWGTDCTGTGDCVLTVTANKTVTATFVDSQAPSVPSGLSASSISPTQINLSWTASTDNVGVTGYEIYRGGVFIGNSATNSYSVTGLSGSTLYSFTVLAYDARGNASAQSTSASATTQAAVANDMFSNAITITGASLTTTGTNVGATKETGEPLFAGNTGGKSVWWSWTAPATGKYTITTFGSSYDTLLGVYTGSSVSGLTLIAANDDASGNLSSVTVDLTGGTVYKIGVDGYSGASGSITLNITPYYQLSVSKTPTAAGTIANLTGTVVTGDIINCGTTCSSVLVNNTAITLRATPSASYTFSGWSGSCTGTGDCAVTMNAAKTVTATFTYVDSSAPTTPSNLTASAVSISQINLSWTASTDDIGVTGYRVYKNGSLVTTVTGTSYSSTGLTSNTSYTYYVQAVDAAGNVSGQSTAVITKTNPKSVGFSVYPSGVGTGSVTGTSINCGTVCSRTVDEGTVITLTAVPASGSVFDSWTGGACSGTDLVCTFTITDTVPIFATFKVAPDTTAPTVSITSPANNTIYSSNQTVTISATAADNIGVVKVEFLKDGVLLSTDTTAPYTATWSLTSADNGDNVFTARAYDAANNVTVSLGVTLVVAFPRNSPPVPLMGWAWSSNIGWISFSSENNNANTEFTSSPQARLFKTANAAAVGYGVTLATSTLNPTTGYLEGWAWSSNIGWIKFGGLSGFPTTGASATNAYVDLNPDSNLGRVVGWIRACSGILNNAPNQDLPGDCSTMQPRADGWDGWIELSGTNHPSPDPGNMSTSTKGVFMNKEGYFTGYAWGGPVVGWINFVPSLLYSGFSVKLDCHLVGTCSGINPSLGSSCGGSSNPTTGVISWTVTATGASSYLYKWNGSPTWTSNSTYTDGISYDRGVTRTGPTVIVADASNTSLTVSPTCPDVTSNKLLGDDLILKIGRNNGVAAIHPITNPLVVSKGSLFKLEWVNTLPVYDPDTEPEGYDCKTVIPSVSGSNWSQKWTSVDGSSSATDLDTPQTGSFEFTVSCTKYDLNGVKTDLKTASAHLRVSNVTEGEI